jgi:hypothetical protein
MASALQGVDQFSDKNKEGTGGKRLPEAPIHQQRVWCYRDGAAFASAFPAV